MKARLGLLCLPLVIGVVMAGCKSSSTSVTVAVSPTSATVLLGTSFRFVATPSGSTNAVQWSVNGVANGNATVGTIDSTGLYTAPATRPVAASAVPVPVIFAVANASVPNSGFTGSVIELQNSSNVANFAPGNTINISGNSQPGWNSSFVIQATGVLSNGQFGVQIATPAGPPANGVGGTATATPNITISAQVTGTSALANATVTLDSGIRVALSQPTCTIGTNETFTFTASVSGSSNQTVTWTVSGVGTINPNTGLYTAPATAGTATVTATSVADPTESASATVTIATAADPTVSALSPTTGALGATRENVYLTGSNFICTTAVLVNGTSLPAGSLSALSSTVFLVVLPDTILSPSSASAPVTLTFTVEREGGSPQACSTVTSCQLVLSPVRPALVASTPDSIPSGSATPVTLDGGYFGTAVGTQTGGFTGAPAVSVQFGGKPILGPMFLSDRQLQFSVPSASVTGPGLYPITVTNTVSGSTNGSVAAINLAVQPTTAPAPIGSPPTVPVGAMPSSVAINTATGFAVVANQGSNNITVINLGTPASPSLSVSTASLCTGSLGSLAGSCVPSAPVSVAVDNLRNLALVANSASPTPTLAVVNLSGTPTVTALLTFPSVALNGTAFQLTPEAVAINPVSGRALVAFSANLSGASGSNVGAILDLTQTPPAVINVVNINNGVSPHIAVSTKLNWALATPGGEGVLSIVDLGRRTTSQITGLTCAAGTPSIASATTASTVSLQVGQPVLVTGVSPAAYNGIFSVTSVSGTQFQYAVSTCPGAGGAGVAAYSLPVASVATDPNVRGVSINDETQKALLAEPTANVPAFVFNILDQSSQLVNGLTQTANNVATAMNPLTNIGLIVNSTANQVLVVNPVTPNELSSFPGTSGASPVDVAIDPASNTALIVNQTINSVSLFSLGGTLRPGAPQIVQTSFSPAGPSQNSSHLVITSSLGSAAVPQDQTVTLLGNFPGTPVLRLDGNCAAFTGSPTITNSGRKLTATISGSFLATNGPRLYALDVADACTAPTAPSNVAPLQVIQAVSVVTSACPNPAPQGVAIDVVHNVAVVTEPGCNHVSLVSLAPGTIGQGQFGATDLAVGSNPQGVATYPQAGLAVVANNFSNNVSIVDVVNNGVPTTFASDPLPAGVAIDLGTGRAVVTASGASLADVFPVSTSTTAPTPATIGVQQGPTGVAIDQKNHVAVVANSSSNTASILNLSSNSVSFTSSGISLPQGVAFDPITGLFMVTSAASNQVFAVNPNTASTGGIRVGIGPSSIAYNFESGTLVTTNNLSGTVSVVDFIDQTVRGVFSLPSSTQFAIDIHPQTNLAVVADTADNEVLLVPLPH
jgi:DNA-binding beta-propeller fold protein YncE